jgi:hypothetical protein
MLVEDLENCCNSFSLCERVIAIALNSITVCQIFNVLIVIKTFSVMPTATGFKLCC